MNSVFYSLFKDILYIYTQTSLVVFHFPTIAIILYIWMDSHRLGNVIVVLDISTILLVSLSSLWLSTSSCWGARSQQVAYYFQCRLYEWRTNVKVFSKQNTATAKTTNIPHWAVGRTRSGITKVCVTLLVTAVCKVMTCFSCRLLTISQLPKLCVKISILRHVPSVLWHCWLGYLTRKNPSPYDL